MANLLSIAEQAWRQVFPNPKDEVAIPLAVFQATAKTEYAYQMWLKHKADKQDEGTYEVPSYLLTEEEFDVANNEIDMKDVKVMKNLHADIWLQNVGGINCEECKYVKSTVNLTQLLCDDDSLGDNVRTYYVVGKKIKFPQGTHKSTLPVIYANTGEKVDGTIEVDDAIGGVVRRALIDIFSNKGNEDKTNNSNSNN